MNQTKTQDKTETEKKKRPQSFHQRQSSLLHCPSISLLPSFSIMKFLPSKNRGKSCTLCSPSQTNRARPILAALTNPRDKDHQCALQRLWRHGGVEAYRPPSPSHPEVRSTWGSCCCRSLLSSLFPFLLLHLPACLMESRHSVGEVEQRRKSRRSLQQGRRRRHCSIN